MAQTGGHSGDEGEDSCARGRDAVTVNYAGPYTERTALLGQDHSTREELHTSSSSASYAVSQKYDEDTEDDELDPEGEALFLTRTISAGSRSGPVPDSLEAALYDRSRGRGQKSNHPRSRNAARTSSTSIGRRHNYGTNGGDRSFAIPVDPPLVDIEANPSGDGPIAPLAKPSAFTSGHATNHIGNHHDDDEEETPIDFLITTDPRRFRLVFSGVMLTYFIACFDGTIMASSHPVITSYFHSSNRASWLSTVFLLSSTAIQPVMGRLSDTLGRKPPYLITMAVFMLATLWCALAGSMDSFIVARAFCGLGAGGMMTLGSILVSDLVPIERRGTYQSYINVVYGLASASGAAFGGLMADTLGWRWEFGIQLFPMAACLIIAILSIPAALGLQVKQKETLLQAMKTFDFKGSVLLTTSTTFLILGLNLGGNVLPWSNPLIIASLVTFGICFPACLYVESRVERPIMPLILLHSTPRANMIFSNFIGSFLLNAILFNAPIFIQAVLLKSPTESGLYLVVPTVTSSTVGTLTGFLITYTRRLKWPLVLGTSSLLLGTVILALARRGWPVWAYLLAHVPWSVGQGFQFPGTTSGPNLGRFSYNRFIAVLAASAQKDQAIVTSTLVLWRGLGSVLGIACSSLVFQNALLRYLTASVTIPDGHDESGGAEWKRAFVERMRSSVEAVSGLPEGLTKDQVVGSYEAAVRVTFWCCVGFAAVSVLLILPMRLPRLGTGRK